MKGILIVEDEPMVARMIAAILAPLSDEPPSIALTMERAMDYLTSGQKFDLITLDLRMPGWLKEQTIAKIKDMKEANGDGLIIVVSGASDPTIGDTVVEAGAHGFIFKPAVAFKDTFLDNLTALGKSLLKQPSKYQQNLHVAERLVEKLVQLKTEEQEPPTV